MTTSTSHTIITNKISSSPKEEVQEIASKGGKASHSGGFASMDPDKQVRLANYIYNLSQVDEYVLIFVLCDSVRLLPWEARLRLVLSRKAVRRQLRLVAREVPRLPMIKSGCSQRARTLILSLN